MSLPGKLTVIMGPMYAGKTSKLIALRREIERATQRVICFKPALDNRYGDGHTISSHNLEETEAITFNHLRPEELLTNVPSTANHIIIDEVQFCAPQVTDVIDQMLKQGKSVVVAGLDLDSEGKAFGPTLTLAEKAATVIRLTAICEKCGAPATHSQATQQKEETVVVGEKNMYIAVCERCFY